MNRKPRIRLLGINAPEPCPAITIVTGFGTIAAHGTCTVSGDLLRVKAKIYRGAELVGGLPPDADPPADAVSGHVENNYDNYSFAAVPNARACIPTTLDPDAADDDNYFTLWEEHRSDPGVWIRLPHIRVCGQMSATVMPVVPATGCIWFAWANATPPGPDEEDIDTHRPVELLVPSNAAAMTVEANPDDIWDHCTGCASNADGIANDRVPLTEPLYRSATYRSTAISTSSDSPNGGIKTNFNRLVGVWQIGDTVPPADSSTDELPFGVGPVPMNTAASAKKLFLGMHDSYQWDNNHNAVRATVTWFENAFPLLKRAAKKSSTKKPAKKAAKTKPTRKK
jgi:hypothetical protein